MYKILSNILLSRLTPYVEEIIGGHQSGFRHSRSSSDHIFCIRQILEKTWEYNEAVLQLFLDLKETYDSVMREVIYNTVTEFGILIKFVRLMENVSEILVNSFYLCERLCEEILEGTFMGVEWSLGRQKFVSHVSY